MSAAEDTSRTERKDSSSGSWGEDRTNRRNEGNPADEEAGRQLEPEVLEKPKIQISSASAEPQSPTHKVLRHSAILSLLSFSAIWGTLTRLGLVALNTYSGQSITPVIWAQAVGCLIMGWAVKNRKDIEEWYPPAYIMITTGYCGCVTTFSTWIVEVFQAFGNQMHYDRHGLHNVMDALTQTAATLGMSLISYSAGHALGEFISFAPITSLFKLRIGGSRSKSNAPLGAQTNATYTHGVDTFSLILGVLFWAASAILCGTYRPFRSVTYSIVLAPFGAILRWYLSRLNSHVRSQKAPYWPLGTLAANLIAIAVLCAVFVGQRVGRVSGSGGRGAFTTDGCHALYGVEEGFCGCLSTISTVAVELTTLRPKRKAVSYAVASWAFGIILCILLIGAPWWSLGMDGSCVGVTLQK